ncbi:MAG: dephospho-CoA kinase, partial [Deltaproteobacteria bacterium]|nr:dephospho-CoA kinase [Deltaproteobacteria bacterium]
ITEEDRERYETLKLSNRIMVVGLTGGIASGKSTVAKLMEELGGIVIDFDFIARKVVRPGEKAWLEIVEYFGEGILLENRELDRKKISDIVFLDPEKRKRLEGFTHPAIGKEFVRQVDDIASRENDAIIQAVIPLLIECGMQQLFHAVAVVYIQREKQVQRLIKRDGITREGAVNIIKAQMPIDEKIRYADFVINNSGTVEETRVQVKHVWDNLLEIKKELFNRQGGTPV